MSRLYDTLRRMENQKRKPEASAVDPDKPVDLLSNVIQAHGDLASVRSAQIRVNDTSRLVALTDPTSLGAEKFRALVARLENLRQKSELRAIQITSAIISEGKSLVAANLAVTLVKHFGYKVLLVEGDLHRPSLGELLGLTNLEGINQWWQNGQKDIEITEYVYNLENVPMSFLSAGSSYDQPSQVLQSSRFAEAFMHLSGFFDWVIVDSTPMSPIVDANLWSRLVDGTLLVVREGVAPIKALKMGVSGLDNPKWLGVVLNEASEFDRVNYSDQYYGAKKRKNRPEKEKSKAAP
jgi:capsular exopolysaccharide synthesis family protein